MIILGSCEKQDHASIGKFFCRKCNELRCYEQRSVSRYLTLFSIPLIKTKTLHESVECQVCNTGYELDMLEPGSQQMLNIKTVSKYSLQ